MTKAKIRIRNKYRKVKHKPKQDLKIYLDAFAKTWKRERDIYAGNFSISLSKMRPYSDLERPGARLCFWEIKELKQLAWCVKKQLILKRKAKIYVNQIFVDMFIRELL